MLVFIIKIAAGLILLLVSLKLWPLYSEHKGVEDLVSKVVTSVQDASGASTGDLRRSIISKIKNKANIELTREQVIVDHDRKGRKLIIDIKYERIVPIAFNVKAAARFNILKQIDYPKFNK